MTLFAFASAKGSPGVTTAVVAAAATWPADRQVLVAELDPAGGDLAARFELDPDPGLVSLTTATGRDGPADILSHTQPLGDGVHVLVAPARAHQVRSCLRSLDDRLGVAVAPDGVDVLADCGRAEPGSPAFALARDAESVVLICRPRAEEVGHLLGTVSDLRGAGADLRLVVVADGPARRDRRPRHAEAAVVADLAGLPLVGSFPYDPRTARLIDGGWRQFRALRRSSLLSAAAAVGARLTALAASPPLAGEIVDEAVADEARLG